MPARRLHLAGLGLVQATSVLFLLGYHRRGRGRVLLAKRLWGDSQAAVVAGLAYALAPYSLAAVYTRGAGAEALALAALPWFLAAFCLLAAGRPAASRPGGRGHLRPGAVAQRGIALRHPFRGVASPWRPSSGKALPRGNWPGRRLAARAGDKRLLLAAGPGRDRPRPDAGDDPGLLLRGRQSVQRDPTRANNPGLRLLARPVQPPGARSGSAGGRFAGSPAPVAHPQAAGGLVAAITLALCTLLQTEAAIPFWTSVPLVRYLQFPWRLLGFSSLAIAILIGVSSGRRQRAGETRHASQGNAATQGALALLLALAIAGAAGQDQPDRRLRDLGRQRGGRGAYGIHVEPARP